MSSTLTLLSLVCLAPPLSLAQVSITTSMVNPDDSPVQIASLRNDLSNLVASVDIRNNSSRTIGSLTLQWAIGVPEACAKNPVSVKFGDPERLSTDTHPGETAKFSNLGPKTSGVIQFLHENSAHFANIQVLVTEVRFTDGTSWSTSIDTSRIFDAGQLQSFDGRCKYGNLVPVASNCAPIPAGSRPLTEPQQPWVGRPQGPTS